MQHRRGMDEPGGFLRMLFARAVGAADPARVVPPCLPPAPRGGRIVAVGAGKAAAGMARAVDEHYAAAAPGTDVGGVVVTRVGQGGAGGRIAVLEATHPLPGAAGLAATERVLAALDGLAPDDLVICLLSGGASALLVSPAQEIPLDDLRAAHAALLRSGARIDEMNAVRKHLSRVKGGRLAARAAPARLVTVLISDVPGDDPQVIASGPTVPDPTTFADARGVIERYGLDLPASVAQHLEAAENETPKPGDPIFDDQDVVMAATPWDALRAAADAAADAGVTPLILGDAIEGESRQVGAVLAGIARSVRARGAPVAPPAVLLSGGETTVTVRGSGRGGPNGECALGLALALDGLAGVHALCADTDGIDGNAGAAGALVHPDTLARARAHGVDPARALADNDSITVFEAADTVLTTGPTGTNVNDFRAVLICQLPVGVGARSFS